jgi:hypothetical protein
VPDETPAFRLQVGTMFVDRLKFQKTGIIEAGSLGGVDWA